MIGYCMKDNDNKHIEFVHHNVVDMNEGKMEYVKFRKELGMCSCWRYHNYACKSSMSKSWMVGSEYVVLGSVTIVWPPLRCCSMFLFVALGVPPHMRLLKSLPFVCCFISIKYLQL